MNRAYALVCEQINKGITRKTIAAAIGYSRTAVSLYLNHCYGAGVENLEAAILKRYDVRLCPADGQKKTPDHCRSIALRPRPYGFPDAETQWLTCQTCPHKPEVKS